MVYIADKNEFEKLSQLVKPLCGWGVTADKNKKIYYSDWSECQREGFFPFFAKLLEKSGDKEIYFYALYNKKILNEYIDETKKYPIVKIFSPFLEEGYYSSINEEPVNILGIDYAVVNTNNYIIFPTSLNWYIYGEYDIELSKLVTNLELPERPDGIPYFITEDEAQEKIKLLNK